MFCQQVVQMRLSVCLSIYPHSANRKTVPAMNTKVGAHILYSSRSACTDPEVKRLKVKVTRLRKPSQRTVASDYSRHPVALWCSTCGRCRRGSACRYDCICFLVCDVVQCWVVFYAFVIRPCQRRPCVFCCPICSFLHSSGQILSTISHERL